MFLSNIAMKHFDFLRMKILLNFSTPPLPFFCQTVSQNESKYVISLISSSCTFIFSKPVGFGEVSVWETLLPSSTS